MFQLRDLKVTSGTEGPVINHRWEGLALANIVILDSKILACW